MAKRFVTYFLRGCRIRPLTKKARKLEKELKKGKILSKKVERGKDLGHYIAPDGWIVARGHLQKILGEIPNLYVTGL